MRSRLESLRMRYSMRPIWAASSSQWWYAGTVWVPDAVLGVLYGWWELDMVQR